MRPREKLLAAGPSRLSDAELLAILLGTGRKGKSAVDLAYSLLSGFEGVGGMARLSPGELIGRDGMGRAKACRVAAAFELGRRSAGSQAGLDRSYLSSAQVFEHFRARFDGQRQEEFVALMLDVKNRPLAEERVSKGTLNASLVHPREVFRRAIRESAARILLVHNHPSGDPAPSAEDRALTARLKEAGELVGIPVVDHVIVGSAGYFSFAEQRLL